MPDALSPDLVGKLHAYWRAANYLSVGQIYLKYNALLEVSLTLGHIKPRLLDRCGDSLPNPASCCGGLSRGLCPRDTSLCR